MTKIKEIKDEKAQKQAIELCDYCFNDTIGWTQRLWPLKNGDRAWGVFEDSDLQSLVIVRNFQAAIFGSLQPMCGISCVASRPESRNRGLVNRLMEEVIKKDYQAGRVFSALYPFKFSFYEKMGYGYVGGAVGCTFEPEELYRLPRPRGAFRKFSGSATELEELYSLYNRWVQQYSFGILYRRQTLREFCDTAKWLKAQDYLYYRDEQLCGYIRYKLSPEGEHKARLSLWNIAWRDKEALGALFGFLAAHRDQCTFIQWSRPRSFPLAAFAPEPRFSQVLRADYMARPLVVESLLRLKAEAYPVSSEITFSIRDPLIEENTATYSISGNGVKKDEFRDENTLPLPLFSSLLFGGISWQEAQLASRVDVNLSPGAETFFCKDENIYFAEGF